MGRLQILGFRSHSKSEPPSSKTLIPRGTSANSGVSQPPQIATTKLENTDSAWDVCKFWGFAATSDRTFSHQPGSKTLIPRETSANSVVPMPLKIGTTKLENTDLARDVCKFWGFEATLIDQAQAQGPDLLELGFERSFELGFERFHRCNRTRNNSKASQPP